MERKLSVAASKGKEKTVKRILQRNKKVDVNWKGEYGWAALHWACSDGNYEILTLLLAHPNIDVNLKTNFGSSPFLLACRDGRAACVRLLLKDPRTTNFHEPDGDKYTPLWYAAYYGRLEVIKFWIASGREMDLGEPGNEFNDAIWVANEKEITKVALLLEKLKAAPTQTRSEIRKEVGWFGDEAELFALVIFLCDGLLEIKRAGRETARFFKIARRLPMELQMLLCHRVVGSMRASIPVEQGELAFKELVKKLN
jgi:hypothetical protein